MDKIRLGVIGIGSMGFSHARKIDAGLIKNAVLSCVCDVDAKRLEAAKNEFAPQVKRYANAADLFKEKAADAVIIATPHYDHPNLAIDAFLAGLHVLIEKPAGVYAKRVKEMNQAAKASGKTFAIMYNMRTNPMYGKIKELVESGEIGEIKRTNWIITSWYRPQSYYNSGGWRATWKGEGGGVLINQCPHQLDLWQWMCGMPTHVRAFMGFGKYHEIETEDDVTAYVEYENGATGVFVTSTADAPGTNRLEISGAGGKLVAENGRLTFDRLRTNERVFNKECTARMSSPECWPCEIPIKGNATSHAGIMQNFVNAIDHNEPLIAKGEEGINGLMISNAMHLSAWTDAMVPIPPDEDRFYAELKRRIDELV